MSNSNTRSDATVSVTYTSKASGDRIDDYVIDELERRTIATITEADAVGDAVVSQTPPDDKTKIWYIADANGVPTGEQYSWNSQTNQWESTSGETPDEFCSSGDDDNMLHKGSDDCWKVSSNDVVILAQAASPQISSDSDNILTQGTDAGWYVPAPDPVPTISTDASNAIIIGGDGGWYAPAATTPTSTDETIVALVTPFTATTTNSTILVDDDTISGNAVVELPTTAVATNGFRFTVKKLGSTGTVTLDPFGSQTVDGNTISPPITVQYESLTVVSDGANWHIL